MNLDWTFIIEVKGRPFVFVLPPADEDLAVISQLVEVALSRLASNDDSVSPQGMLNLVNGEAIIHPILYPVYNKHLLQMVQNRFPAENAEFHEELADELTGLFLDRLQNYIYKLAGIPEDLLQPSGALPDLMPRMRAYERN